MSVEIKFTKPKPFKAFVNAYASYAHAMMLIEEGMKHLNEYGTVTIGVGNKITAPLETPEPNRISN